MQQVRRGRISVRAPGHMLARSERRDDIQQEAGRREDYEPKVDAMEEKTSDRESCPGSGDQTNSFGSSQGHIAKMKSTGQLNAEAWLSEVRSTDIQQCQQFLEPCLGGSQKVTSEVDS